MKTNSFAIAILMATGYASTSLPVDKIKQENMQKFMNWTTQNGKDYSNKDEFDRRMGLWLKADDFIKAQNEKSKNSNEADPLILAHNFLSDMTTDEKLAMLKVKESPKQKTERLRSGRYDKPYSGTKQSEKRDGRKLCGDEGIDWVRDGKVTRVKDQGGCGSCYAFGAITVLESQIAIQTGQDPMHLAEQQVVDCAHYDKTGGAYYTFGCNGGWPASVWVYARDKGMMLNSDYPYRANDGNCQFTESKVDFNITHINWGDGWAEHPDTIVDKLTNGPMSVALQANCEAFYYYSSGVVRTSDCPLNRIDHAVVLTGYMPATGSPYEYSYYVDGVEHKATLSGEEAVFTIQNSWSEWWGQGGFIKVAVEEGPGFGFMNEYLETIELNSIRIKD